MATLITGAGLIGTAFARHALKRGEEIVFFDLEPRDGYIKFRLTSDKYEFVRGDVRDLPALAAAMSKFKVNTVVHTAGLIGTRVLQSLSQAFDINLGGTRNVAEAMRLSGAKRLVHISTFGVYDLRLPAGEHVSEDHPRGGARGYGNYKGAKELILEAYAPLYGLELIMLRPANVFGFGHFAAGSTGGMKMQALVTSAVEGTVARIPSTETMANEYIYADDMGHAVDAAATVAMPPVHTFNIGNGVVSTFEEVVDSLSRVAPGAKYEIETGPKPVSKNAPLDISRAAQHLKWKPTYDLSRAFADYLDELKRARAAGL
jgi:UDP-glucose 4-epimerase